MTGSTALTASLNAASPTAAFTSSNAGTLTETFISVRSSGLIVTWYSTWSKSAARTSTACRGAREGEKLGEMGG